MSKKEIKIEKVDLRSEDIIKEQISKFKQLFPEVFSEGKINFEKLKATLGEDIGESSERYEMNWAGKTNCFKIIQEQSLGTLKPLVEESINWGDSENLFIEGDNLEVLKLLQKSYNEKIKMIYIDPPYNTGHDFVYRDKFGQQLDEYLKLTGQVDEQGKALSTNTESDGRYHSNWMNMIYPRLFLARNLLKDDGVIFISIDDNEVDNLKKICNEIFGEENFIAQLVWKKTENIKMDSRFISINKEYLLCYRKGNLEEFNKILSDIERYSEEDAKGRYYLRKLDSKSSSYSRGMDYVIEHEGKKYYAGGDYEKWLKRQKEPPKKKDATWLWSKQTFEKGLTEGEIIFKNGNVYNKVRYDGTAKKPYIDILDFVSGQTAQKELDDLFKSREFDHPKPVSLIKHLIEMVTSKEDIILDFFAGSGTTAQAVMEHNFENNSNNKFILVQLPEKIGQGMEGSNRTYKTISDLSKDRIKRAIKKILKESGKQKDEDKTNNIDLGLKIFRLDKSNFKIWDAQTKDIQTALNEHINPIRKESSQEDVLYELILKSGLSLTTDIKEIKIGNKKVFSIEDGMLLICLEKELTSELIKKIAEMKPARFYCLDEGFKGNDQLKANAVEIFKNVETVDGEKIVFRTAV